MFYMLPKFFELAKKMSLKSNHHQHRIGGVVVNKSKVISLGFNKCKTHPKSNQPFKNIHCELDCILGVDKKLLKGASIYLYRETKEGMPAISKPCKWCEALLRESEIKTVFYTDAGMFKQQEIN